jgi:hypothetical protein
MYEDMETLRKERGLEQHGIVGEAEFVDVDAQDYRLNFESAAVARLAGMRYPAAGMNAIVCTSDEEPDPRERPSPRVWASE